jgi:hypothetical protein
MLKDRKQISKGRWVPVHLKHIPQSTPGKSSQRTVKKDVLDIFSGMAQLAQAIQTPVTMTNLVIGRQAPSGQLPDEDSHFEGASDFPDIFSVGNGCTLN